MADILIKQVGDDEWRAPSSRAVADEAELQQILVSSPNLLPGPDDIPLVAVQEFPLSSGRVDIVAVAADGTIVVVECKLRANPEIRRQVLGQVLAYASALWQMPYEQFEETFERRAGRSMTTMVEFSDEGDWDANEFRKAVSANLQSGAFRVVVAVDEITDELKRTISYLNSHTTNELEIVALELGYVRDGDVEMLIPIVYGEEAVVAKRQARATRWNEESFWEHAETESSPGVLAVIRDLYQWGVDRDASYFWGEGKRHPSMTAWIAIDGEEAPIWTCYLGDSDATVLGLNFEWLTSRVSQDSLKQLADDLRVVPEAASLLVGIEDNDYKRRPNVPINEVLTRPNAMSSVLEAYNRLIEGEQE